MDELFKKTINYFNTGSVDDDFVGQIVEVGEKKLKILRKIAEGKRIREICLRLFVVIRE
jgi:DNA-binding NarL/FixJ family response regulator